MLSSQQRIISRVAAWLEEGRPVWLCTILKTWGSSPRPVGAMMACDDGGRQIGSISGGCIEEDFLRQLRDGRLKARFEARGGGPLPVEYGATAEEQARLKLPCGGRLQVLLERLEPSGANRAAFARLAGDLDAHRRASRVVDLATGRVSADARRGGEAVAVDGGEVVHSLSPAYRLLLLGAGDVAKYVAELALGLEYDVTLCDPRPGYLDDWHVEGVETTSALPDDVVRERFGDPYSGVVALAHDPRVDDMALMQALKTSAFYVGAMGSERTSLARRARLPELGLSEGEIGALRAPIGLRIGSKTPAEIAISIMAEITAVRHQAEAAAS